MEIEPDSMGDSYGAVERIEENIKSRLRMILGLDAIVKLVSPNTLRRFEGKAKRVTDLRKEGN